jgi:hypothetical protein
MKVLDLHCREHVFEGWFASEEDFQSQLGRGLVQCPLCGDEQVQKRLSAPRLNLRASASARAPVPTAETFASASATLRRFPGCGVAAADAASRCPV